MASSAKDWAAGKAIPAEKKLKPGTAEANLAFKKLLESDAHAKAGRHDEAAGAKAESDALYRTSAGLAIDHAKQGLQKTAERASKVAEKATTAANKDGSPEAHRAAITANIKAMDANYKVGGFAPREGDAKYVAKAQEHSKAVDVHESKAGGGGGGDQPRDEKGQFASK